MFTQYSNLAGRGRLVLQPFRVAIALHHWFVRRIATQSCHAFQKRGTVQRRAIRNVPRGAPALGPHRHQRIRTGARIVGWCARNLDDDKRVLGIARLVHFLALAYVVHYSGLTQLLRRTAIFAPLCLIGRYSLPVFATGAILCTIGLMVMDEDWPSMPYSLIILAGGLAIHYLVAGYLSIRSESQRNGIVIDRLGGGFLGAGIASGADRVSPP